jgi:hypothetical protein
MKLLLKKILFVTSCATAVTSVYLLGYNHETFVFVYQLTPVAVLVVDWLVTAAVYSWASSLKKDVCLLQCIFDMRRLNNVVVCKTSKNW